MPICQHHVQWVREIPGGLHQCGLCSELVAWKDVYPKPEDLTEDFRSRWRAHEATVRPGAPAEPTTAPAPA
jgi:hypothetical protein